MKLELLPQSRMRPHTKLLFLSCGVKEKPEKFFTELYDVTVKLTFDLSDIKSHQFTILPYEMFV